MTRADAPVSRLDLRKVAHFVAVVEEGSMTGAARRLGLTQQALSMSIRALERDLGVSLLHRNRRGAGLLPAGRLLYRDGVQLLSAATTALERVRHADRHVAELLRIGHTSAVSGAEIIEMLAGLRPAPAPTSMRMIQIASADLGDRLWDRSIDLGMSRSMSPAAGLTGLVVARHRLRVAVRREHRLARRNVLNLRDIADETLMVSAPEGGSGDTDLLLSVCRRAGIEPRYGINPVQGTPPVTAVLRNDGVALVTDPPGAAVGGAVRVIELKPVTTIPLLAAWRRDATSRARDILVDALAG
jgi:DNA-binding transcriptional LysR family regulator